MPSRYARKHNIGEPLDRSEIGLPSELAGRVNQLQHGYEAWAEVADAHRVAGDIEDSAEVNEGFNALLAAHQELLRLNPPHAASILEQLASSTDATTRFMATRGLDVAYFADPESCRPLVTRLLTDPDARVVAAAHDALEFFGNDAAFGERRDDGRGSISLDYIAALPVHRFAVVVVDGAKEVTVTPRVPSDFWPPLQD